LLALALAAVWLAWAVLPTRPLREWATVSREPDDWRLTPDRTRLACTTRILRGDINLGAEPEYGPVRLWDLATGRERLTPGANQPMLVTLRMAPDGTWLLIALEPPGPDGEVALQLWDIQTGRERWSTTILSTLGDQLPANHIVSPDGRFIACRRR